MRILLTGASGLVGAAFARTAAAAGHEVTGVVGRWPGAVTGLTRQLALDLQDGASLRALVRATQPDAVVNAAAISEPAQCDDAPEPAWRLNVALPEVLAQEAAAHGARLLHLSTEQVFDGNRAPYSIGDARRAINRYAAQKLEAEDRVLAAAGVRAVVLRIPLLLGHSPGGRRSVHERLLQLWSGGGTARLYRDEIRQPCTADSVAAVLVELLDRSELHGPLHWAGAAPISRLALGERIRAHFHLTAAQAPIVAVERAGDAAALAGRQADLSLSLAPLGGLLATRPETIDAALGRLVLPPWWTPRA
jgi:dTDP-4-dehydrorhamnose reductase